MTTEIRNWAVVAAAMEAKGATNSDMYRRAKALAGGNADPMPTSHPAAPLSISAAWSTTRSIETLNWIRASDSTKSFLMTNQHLSVEQRFHLEAAFREIDGCNDIEKLRSLTKEIITAQENEKAFAREAIAQIRKEMEAAAQQRFGFNWGSSGGWDQVDQWRGVILKPPFTTSDQLKTT